MARDTNNSVDDEFGISEDEFNRRHKKALKDAEPSGKKKRKKRKKKEHNWCKGLGSSNRSHLRLGGKD